MQFSIIRFQIIGVLCLSIVQQMQAQAWSSTELERLANETFIEKRFERRKPDYVFKNSGFLVKFNPLSLAFGGLLFTYQKAISPQISVDCPYEINCSNFSKHSLRKFGLLKGLALTADRLTRCTQYTLIDLLPSQVNKNYKIIDSLSSYSLHRHR